MSRRIKDHIHHLEVLSRGKPKMQRALIQAADREFMLCLCECVDNVIKGNVPMTSAQIDKLKSKRHLLRKLCNRRISLKKKKAALLQRGNGLSLLTGLLVKPLIGLMIKKITAAALGGGRK